VSENRSTKQPLIFFSDSTRIKSSPSEDKSNSSYYSARTSSADVNLELREASPAQESSNSGAGGGRRSNWRENDNGNSMLDNLTMINSPLHLDSIL
jgi:hypothetical protein